MYLWINLADLTLVGTLGDIGSPIALMFQEGELIPGTVSHPKSVDEVYIVLKVTDERAKILQDAIILVGEKKIKRNIRMRATKRPPTKVWRWSNS